MSQFLIYSIHNTLFLIHSQRCSDSALLLMKDKNALPPHERFEGFKSSAIGKRSSSDAALLPSPNKPKYRRTKCKTVTCPHNGSECPHHGHDIKICIADETCMNRAVQGGVCSRHGAKRPLCQVDECTNQAKKDKLCIKHGNDFPRCKNDSCGNLARSGGLCRKHGAK